jgi:UDP-glucose 4-epimerase
MQKILITGGAGFIGYHLASRLAGAGHQVVIMDNFSRGVSDPFLRQLSERGVRLETVDLIDEMFPVKIDDDFDYIYHLAAIIGVANVLERPFEVLRDNTRMLLNMIELARCQRNLKRFMFPSTSEVYAGTLYYFDLPIPTPEATPLAITALEHPRTSYMLSKIYGEALCHHAGIPFTIIRPHNVYGPRMGMSHVIPELLGKAYRASDGGELEIFSRAHMRTFCYVDDAIDLMIALMESEAGANGTFNIGSSADEISIGDIGKLIIECIGKNLTLAACDDTPGSPTRRCPDMTKTLEVTSKKDFVPLSEGVRRCFEWYERNIFAGDITSAK